MSSVEWPNISELEDLLCNILDLDKETVSNGKKDEWYRKAFKKLISGHNEEKFYKLIDECLHAWRKPIQNVITEVDNKYELLAHSLHYKSPGLGKWFRWPFLTGEGDNILGYDKPLLDIYAEK